MSRYAIGKQRVKSLGEWDDDLPMLPCLSVDSSEPVDTGLITPTGEPIMRLPEPIGFHRVSK